MISVERSLNIGSLNIWWTLWIINNLLGQFVFCYSLRAEALDELTGLTIVSIINNLIGISLALITVKIIKSHSEIKPPLQEIVYMEKYYQSLLKVKANCPPDKVLIRENLSRPAEDLTRNGEK